MRAPIKYVLTAQVFRSIISLVLLVGMSSIEAEPLPFEACPTRAFIIQKPGSVPKTYGVDMATGSYSTFSEDMGTVNGYNGVGFSEHDSFLYGWDYQRNQVSRTGTDFQITDIGSFNKDTQSEAAGNFFVGDVAINENAWYGYRKNHGMFKVPLDTGASYLMSYIPGSIDGASHTIMDMAFHPSDGYIYAMTSSTNSHLIQIDPATGLSSNLGLVLTSPNKMTFGAQFFDVNGNMYISDNHTGIIYKVNIASLSAEAFSYGPSSTSNDGARCANADIPVASNVDFGDAPDSYGTLMASNGARHETSSALYLGDLVDNESDAHLPLLSDDLSDGSDDEDGISFPTGFEVGEQAMINAAVSGTSGSGYLNAWFDWNANGSFEADERAISAQAISNGNNSIAFTVPVWAVAGPSWARFRISSTADIIAKGGVADGEVEDYPVVVTTTGVAMTYYPNASSYTAVAYEDLFPLEGDFDMNDVIMHLRFIHYVKSGMIHSIRIKARLVAMGAGFHNGFAIQIPGLLRSNIHEASISWTIDGVTQSTSPLETGQTNAVFIFADDLWHYATADEGEGCKYFRTQAGCGSSAVIEWDLTGPFVNSVSASAMPGVPFDPFIFSAPGYSHGQIVTDLIGSDPGRGLEIHLKNKAPTDKFDNRLLGAGHDISNPATGSYFQNADGQPWALEVPDTWSYPLERQSLNETYGEFMGFAGDISGETNSTWYLNANGPVYVNKN